MGNVRSVYNALKYLGAEPVTARAPSEVRGEKLVIPGVGAFGDGVANLRPFFPKIREFYASGLPLLGICLGLQVLFEGSEESPGVEGLGVLRGKVVRIGTDLRLPHIGWNSIEVRKGNCPLFRGVDDGFAYFVHSYHALPEEAVVAATASYGCSVTASVWRGNLFGTQFHPEKSGAVGLQILENFLEL